MKYRMRDLENFAATAECPTMGEAARRLEISQPALSESIQRLEEDAGAALFYRSRQGIQLTPRGRLFLGKVQDLLRSAQNLELEPSAEKVFNGQSISIGCHVTVAAYSLPDALAILRKSAPDYQISLRHDLSRNVQAEIQRGRLDLGIVINPTSVPDVVISKLGVDTVSVWRAKDLKDEDTLIYNPALFQSQSILKKWKSKPRKSLATEGLELICRLTGQGLGYGIIPSRAVALSKEPLQRVSSLPSYKDEIALVHRPEFGKTKAEKLVIEAIKASLLKSALPEI